MTEPQDGAHDPEDTRRKFREALDRKKAAGAAHQGPRGAAELRSGSSNDKRQRQFRRKSG